MGYHTELPKPHHLVPIPLSPSSTSAATLIARSHRIKLAADLGLARALLLRRRRRRHRGAAHRSKPYEAEIAPAANGNDDGGEAEKRGGEEEEEEGVEERVRALRRLVPGGEGMGVETLFEETADYIEALHGQVSAMRALASLLHGLERESESSTTTTTITTTTTTTNTMGV